MEPQRNIFPSYERIKVQDDSQMLKSNNNNTVIKPHRGAIYPPLSYCLVELSCFQKHLQHPQQCSLLRANLTVQSIACVWICTINSFWFCIDFCFEAFTFIFLRWTFFRGPREDYLDNSMCNLKTKPNRIAKFSKQSEKLTCPGFVASLQMRRW